MWTKEVNTQLEIEIDNTPVPTIKNPKILGVTFDPLLTFNTHTKNVKDKMQSRNNVMKSIAGSTWGKDKETLTTTYKAIGRPVVNYAAPIYTPQLCNINWKKLQTVENASLRIITGCHKMSNVDHLH